MPTGYSGNNFQYLDWCNQIYGRGGVRYDSGMPMVEFCRRALVKSRGAVSSVCVSDGEDAVASLDHLHLPSG